MKPRGLHAADAAARAPSHSFPVKRSNSQITHLGERTGSVCCLSMLAPGGKKEQADKLCVCGAMWGREQGRGQYGNFLS